MSSGRETGRLTALKTYVGECWQLLYGVFFKPYSLDRWLVKIDPNLASKTSLSSLSKTLANPKLQRLVGQYWRLSLVLPWLITGAFGGLYPFITGLPFVWDLRIQFLSGWSIGIGLFIVTPKSPALFKSIPWILTFATPCFFLIPFIVPNPFQLVAVGVLFGLALGVALGAAGGVAVGVVVGVAFGVALSVFFGMTVDGVVDGIVDMAADFMALVVAGGVVGGVAANLTGGVFYGVMLGVISGVVFGMGGGVAVGVAVGVVFGVVFILGAIRFYFWVPELLWMFFLSLIRPRNPLKWLPPPTR